MIIISAMSKDRVIGNANGDGMPWNVPDEYHRFLSYVKNQTVIMGRKSYDIFKGDLSSSELLVISRSNPDLPKATVCASLAIAIEKARETKKEIYIAGGGAIYELALPYVEKMYLSYIKGDYTGNTYFPEFDRNEWLVETREDHPEYEFVSYKKIGQVKSHEED